MPKREERVVHQDDHFIVTRFGSGGRSAPSGVKIRARRTYVQGPNPNTNFYPRVLGLSLDELFELTDILDELCDSIEDEQNELAKKTRA